MLPAVVLLKILYVHMELLLKRQIQKEHDILNYLKKFKSEQVGTHHKLIKFKLMNTLGLVTLLLTTHT